MCKAADVRLVEKRFEVRCNLEYGWHVVDMASNALVVDEFGPWEEEAREFCGVMERAWRESDLAYACPDVAERFRHRVQ